MGRTAIYGGSTRIKLNLKIGIRVNREIHSDFLTTLSESSPANIPEDLANTVEIGEVPISRDIQKQKYEIGFDNVVEPDFWYLQELAGTDQLAAVCRWGGRYSSTMRQDQGEGVMCDTLIR